MAVRENLEYVNRKLDINQKNISKELSKEALSAKRNRKWNSNK